MRDKTIKLHDDELAAKVNSRTGEVTTIQHRPNNIPKGKELFEPKAPFKKSYPSSWMYLRRCLTPMEYNAAHLMSIMAKFGTNSLEPLSDETTKIELAETLGIHRNSVDKIVTRLHQVGVFAGWDVYRTNKGRCKFWVVNPYLSFSGQVLDSEMAELFHGTYIHRAFLDPEYDDAPNRVK